jgi:predicted Zn-dependent protease with MMP-like domain
MKSSVLDENFEDCVREAYNSLPKYFLSKIDNVEIVIEDYPSESIHGNLSNGMLLGLYSGVPLNRRGSYYGTYPTLPDRITIFKKNIMRTCDNESELIEKTYEVLFHEIGHYFGMNEDEIRSAMKDFRIQDFKANENS